jgi:hypothetical protein
MPVYARCLGSIPGSTIGPLSLAYQRIGVQDFYDYKVTSAEGFGKDRLFSILDDLESRSRHIMVASRQRLAADKGEAALQPWNMGWALAGDTEKAMDPYFPFEDAVDVWARTFAALGIRYRGSTMALDLCDRQGKYSNGFCHWPQPAWRKPDGTWVPAKVCQLMEGVLSLPFLQQGCRMPTPINGCGVVAEQAPHLVWHQAM